MVTALLDAGVDPTVKDGTGATALGLALGRSRDTLPLVELLLARGARVTDGVGSTTPLHLAALWGKAPAVAALLAAGAEVGATAELGETPLHHAKGAAVARALLEAGASSDAKDIKGRTPLDCLGKEGSEWYSAEAAEVVRDSMSS